MGKKKLSKALLCRGNQKGFTLIELIIVIVILGILAVIAIPKYADMRNEAAAAAADGVYGAAQAAAAVRFAANLAGKGELLINDGSTLMNAMDGTPEGWSPSGDTITATVNSVVYTITVATDETSSSKAILSKTGF